MDSGGEDKREAAYGPEGRGFYGAVTVSERGQVVIPAQARRDLGIEPGDKLLVLADPKEGLALVKIDQLLRRPLGPMGLLRHLQEGEGEA
ncbi:AbrB/MazE/SpoVT family DNA-binding domain-containing protein [Streptomyces sp. 6N223]|uniref:AbrB/MazE/SpoVT family DNA-binding domain-containing protein n=1 Tax=Streptomyces sp. 6N223 TaxID=3457412 RepID=UPI003FD688C8